jgi:predicted phosphodiesterase
LRIGLASDTFGNVGALERALDRFARASVDRVFFLGGRYGDVDAALARLQGGSRDAKVPETDLDFLGAVEGALARTAAAADDPIAGRIVRVASRACPEHAGGAPTKVVDLLDGKICCLVHDKAELTRDDIANASLLFHGNSGHAALVQIGPRCFVTPGHLREPAPDGKPATFAILEVGGKELALTVLSAAGAELRTDRVALVPQGKISVR